MPILRMREIRAMSPEERIRRVVELRMELMRLRAIVKAGGAVENYARIREIKKTIARILTVQREEELKLGRGSSK
ncbi:50S ribosomal protein L29 [Candidatus Bathyarchaeota archaeon]|nr:50S ribosomal protein L29 [Candidatus Bathyarchaeota archaeon]